MNESEKAWPGLNVQNVLGQAGAGESGSNDTLTLGRILTCSSNTVFKILKILKKLLKWSLSKKIKTSVARLNKLNPWRTLQRHVSNLQTSSPQKGIYLLDESKNGSVWSAMARIQPSTLNSDWVQCFISVLFFHSVLFCYNLNKINLKAESRYFHALRQFTPVPGSDHPFACFQPC